MTAAFTIRFPHLGILPSILFLACLFRHATFSPVYWFNFIIAHFGDLGKGVWWMALLLLQCCDKSMSVYSAFRCGVHRGDSKSKEIRLSAGGLCSFLFKVGTGRVANAACSPLSVPSMTTGCRENFWVLGFFLDTAGYGIEQKEPYAVVLQCIL